MLIEANRMDPKDLQSWVFCPGMRFQSPRKWWGDHGRRDFPHEGIDLCLYADRTGQVIRLDRQTRIPAVRDGLVRAVFADYLGRAVVIEHENTQADSGRFLSVYAHTAPETGIQPGVAVKQGQIIATIAGTGHSKADILPHLHLTLGRASPQMVYEPFVWNVMRDPRRITLQDPLAVVDWPCRELDPSERICAEL